MYMYVPNMHICSNKIHPVCANIYIYICIYIYIPGPGHHSSSDVIVK